MLAYKYVEPAWADAFAAGESFKIGSFQHYRDMEGQRADKLEGKVQHRIDHARFSVLDSNTRARLEKFGISLTNVSDIVFNNVSVEHRIPLAFMFCASLKRNSKLVEDGLVEFEIFNFKRFVRSIGYECERLGPMCSVKHVQYTERAGNILNGPILKVDPFKKDPAFRWEREVRAVWKIRELKPDANEFIVVRSLEASKYLKRLSN